MFGVYEGADATGLLRFSDTFERERGFARRLGAVNLDDSAARQTTHAQSEVEAQRPGRDDRNIARDGIFAELHYGALAKLLFDLAQGQVERLTFDILYHSPFSPMISPTPPGFPYPRPSLLALHPTRMFT